MKLTIPQLNLAALIARGSAAVAKNSQITILNFVRITARADGTMALGSTDMDRFAEASAACSTIDTPGTVCVEASAFTTLIGKHPKAGLISLELDEGRLTVSCGRSKVRLPTLDPSGFPAWADQAPEAEFDIPGTDFAKSLNRVKSAASTELARVHLQGVCLDAHDGSLHFVATNGHRLAVSGIKAPEGAQDCPQIIVPSEAVEAALRVFKDSVTIRVAANTKAVSFSADGLRLSCRLIDGVFPDYARVIPERGSPGVTFKRADFVDCLDRANVLVGEGQYSAIMARPDGDTLVLESRNQSGGDACEQLSAVIDDDFKPFGFSPRYAAQFLAALNVNELTIEQSGPSDPHLIYSDDAPDFIGVLMPMRV